MKQEALQRWGRVARKDLDSEMVNWLASVAHDLIAATAEKDTNARRLATVRAVRLNGRESTEAHLTRVMVNEAAPLVAIAERARRTKIMVGMATNHVPGTRTEISEEAMRKRIERARKNKA